MINKNQSRRNFLGLVATSLVALTLGCEKDIQKPVVQTPEQIENAKRQYEERKRKQEEKLASYKKAKQDFETQKLNGRPIQFANSNGTMDYRYPVDKVLANYDGYSILYTELDTKKLVEIRLKNFDKKSVEVIVDLNDTDQPYAILRNHCTYWNGAVTYTATIHIKSLDCVSGGDDFVPKTGKNYDGRGIGVHHKREVVFEK